MKRILPIGAGTSAASATLSTASLTGGMRKRQSARAGPASGRNTAEALRRSMCLRTSRGLSHRLAEQHRIVEHKIDGPDPAGAHECLWITPVAGHAHDADLLIEVLECPRPFRVVKIWIHPAVRNRIVDCETMLAAGRQLRQRMDTPAEMRGVVDVAVLDHVVGMLQRRDVERLRFP